MYRVLGSRQGSSIAATRVIREDVGVTDERFGGVSAEDLLDRVVSADSDAVVLSALYDRVGDDYWLRHASLLTGPPSLREFDWAGWHQAEQVPGGATVGYIPSLKPEWHYQEDTFVAARMLMTLDQARDWLAELLATDELPAAGPLPTAHARLKSGRLVHVFPHLETPLARLAVHKRPLSGFFFECESRPQREFPGTWRIDGKDVISASFNALAMHIPAADRVIQTAPPSGLLVAAMERRAWLIEFRGDGKEQDQMMLHIGWDSERFDLSEFEVELEEWDGDELLYSRRLSLADTDTSTAQGLDRAIVGLPTLGVQLRHRASLHDREGALLDITEPNPLLEQINFTFSISGPDGGVAHEQKFSVGALSEPPTLKYRLQHLDGADESYRKALEDGLADRIVTSPAQARVVIQQQLTNAKGILRIMDPYFGADALDWQILQGVLVPVEVLTGAKAKSPPATLTDVTALKIDPALKQAPHFHDRLYLWEGGGLSVGTSPSGLGKRVARIDRINPIEAGAWTAMFSGYWTSGDYVPF
jgi:hypothetical protein